MSIINKITLQELNDSLSKNRRAETNETLNKLLLILPYSGKQGKKINYKDDKIYQENLNRKITDDSDMSK